jgi:hypothetical protein
VLLSEESHALEELLRTLARCLEPQLQLLVLALEGGDELARAPR